MPEIPDSVVRFERNLADHALYIYRCARCGRHWGRYMPEEKVACECGEMPDGNAMVVEPETLISAWLNNGRVLCQRK